MSRARGIRYLFGNLLFLVSAPTAFLAALLCIWTYLPPPLAILSTSVILLYIALKI